MSKGPPSTASHFLLESLQLGFRSNQLSETAFRNVSREHAQPSPTASVLVRASEVYRPQLRQPNLSSFPQTWSDSWVSPNTVFYWAIRILLVERGFCGSSRSSWPQGHELGLAPFQLHTHFLQGSSRGSEQDDSQALWTNSMVSQLCWKEASRAPSGHWAGTYPPTPHLSCQPEQLCF